MNKRFIKTTDRKNRMAEARRAVVREERAARRAHLTQRREEFKEAEKHEYYGDERLAKMRHENDAYWLPKFLLGVVIVLAILALFDCGAHSLK